MSLPAEIWVEIFSYISTPKNIHSLRGTCHLFKDSCEENLTSLDKDGKSLRSYVSSRFICQLKGCKICHYPIIVNNMYDLYSLARHPRLDKGTLDIVFSEELFGNAGGKRLGEMFIVYCFQFLASSKPRCKFLFKTFVYPGHELTLINNYVVELNAGLIDSGLLSTLLRSIQHYNVYSMRLVDCTSGLLHYSDLSVTLLDNKHITTLEIVMSEKRTPLRYVLAMALVLLDTVFSLSGISLYIDNLWKLPEAVCSGISSILEEHVNMGLNSQQKAITLELPFSEYSLDRLLSLYPKAKRLGMYIGKDTDVYDALMKTNCEWILYSAKRPRLLLKNWYWQPLS